MVLRIPDFKNPQQRPTGRLKCPTASEFKAQPLYIWYLGRATVGRFTHQKSG